LSRHLRRKWCTKRSGVGVLFLSPRHRRKLHMNRILSRQRAPPPGHQRHRTLPWLRAHSRRRRVPKRRRPQLWCWVRLLHPGRSLLHQLFKRGPRQSRQLKRKWCMRVEVLFLSPRHRRKLRRSTTLLIQREPPPGHQRQRTLPWWTAHPRRRRLPKKRRPQL